MAFVDLLDPPPVGPVARIEIRNVTPAKDGSETVDSSEVDTYDEHGRLTSRAHYDANGKPGYRYDAKAATPTAPL
jgi:hypothetical protein